MHICIDERGQCISEASILDASFTPLLDALATFLDASLAPLLNAFHGVWSTPTALTQGSFDNAPQASGKGQPCDTSGPFWLVRRSPLLHISMVCLLSSHVTKTPCSRTLLLRTGNSGLWLHDLLQMTARLLEVLARMMSR